MHFAIFISIVASIVQMYGYWLYNKGIYAGGIKPNATSWGLWAFGSIIATWSYFELVHDWTKVIFPIACCVVCIGTFVFAWFKGKFEAPKKEDVLIAMLDILVVVFWLFTESATMTNLLMQVDVIISFYPILRGVLANPRSEEPKPWFVWTAAYALFFIAVILSWEKWWDIMYPVVYFALHLAVGLIAKYRTARP